MLALLLIAIITRFVFLDARPMDHDESIHAFLSYDLLKNQRYTYNPAFHGPFLYFSTAGIFWLFGDSDFTSRIVPAVFSLIALFIAFKFERWLNSGAYFFAFFMIFSTSILYYSRYLRNDIIVLASFLVLIYCYFRFGEEIDERRKERYAYVGALFLAVMITSKENSYIYVFIIVSFILFYGLYEKRIEYLRELLLRWNLKKLKVILISSLIFSVIFSSLYTSGFSDLEGLRRATIGALEHWFTMHSANDHSKPLPYYMALLLRYEFLPLALAISSIPLFYRKLKEGELTKLEVFSVYWLLMSLLAYHVLSHKVPWLLTHLVAPIAFFSSIYSKESFFEWSKRGFRVAIVVVGIIYLAASLHITYINYNDASEGLIYIQVQPTAVELSEKIIYRIENGEHGIIVEPNNDYWPLPWYLRKITVPFSRTYYGNFDFVVTSETNLASFKGWQMEGRYEIRPGYYLVLLEK